MNFLEIAYAQLEQVDSQPTDYVEVSLSWGKSPVELINMLLAYSLLGAAFLSVVYIFVGGISFILSGGQEDKIKKSVNTIRYSIIGLIVTILSFTIITTVGKAFGFELVKYISIDKLWHTINYLTSSAPDPASQLDTSNMMEGIQGLDPLEGEFSLDDMSLE